MGKSGRSRSSVVKSITKTASKTLPLVDRSLKTVGSTAKNVASESIPVIEKSISAVYGTMATGLDLGVKGAKSLAKDMSKRRRTKRRSVSRSRSLAGGRRTRRRY
jgi:hypothetical protein